MYNGAVVSQSTSEEYEEELESTFDEYGRRAGRLTDWGLVLPDSSRGLDNALRHTQNDLKEIMGKMFPLETVRAFLLGEEQISPNDVPDNWEPNPEARQRMLDDTLAIQGQGFRRILEKSSPAEKRVLGDPALRWITETVIPWVQYYYNADASYRSEFFAFQPVLERCPLPDLPLRNDIPARPPVFATANRFNRANLFGRQLLADLNHKILHDRNMCIVTNEYPEFSSYGNVGNTPELFGLQDIVRGGPLQTMDAHTLSYAFTQGAYPAQDSMGCLAYYDSTQKTAYVDLHAMRRYLEYAFKAVELNDAHGGTMPFPVRLSPQYTEFLSLGRSMKAWFGNDIDRAAQACSMTSLPEEVRHGMTSLRFNTVVPRSMYYRIGRRRYNEKRIAFMARGGILGPLCGTIQKLSSMWRDALGRNAWMDSNSHTELIENIVAEVEGKMTSIAVGFQPKTYLGEIRAELRSLAHRLRSPDSVFREYLNPTDSLINMAILYEIGIGAKMNLPGTFHPDRFTRLTEEVMGMSDARRRDVTADRFQHLFNYGYVDEPPFPQLVNGRPHARIAGDIFSTYAPPL